MVGHKAWWLLFGPWLLTGCPCGREDSTVAYQGGTADAGTYQSSSWQGPWLHFPGGRRYLLAHHLGRTPATVTTYLSFKEYPGAGGNPDDKPGNASQAAGNEALIEQVDAVNIRVRNDTCSDFYLLVVAQAGPAVTDAGAD
jgi:hypothetical protein